VVGYQCAVKVFCHVTLEIVGEAFKKAIGRSILVGAGMGLEPFFLARLPTGVKGSRRQKGGKGVERVSEGFKREKEAPSLILKRESNRLRVSRSRNLLWSFFSVAVLDGIKCHLSFTVARQVKCAVPDAMPDI